MASLVLSGKGLPRAVRERHRARRLTRKRRIVVVDERTKVVCCFLDLCCERVCFDSGLGAREESDERCKHKRA